MNEYQGVTVTVTVTPCCYGCYNSQSAVKHPKLHTRWWCNLDLADGKYGKPSSYPTIYAAVVLSLDESYSKIEEIKPLK